MTFRYSATLGGFDDSPLSDFIRDKEVVSFREHFYLVNEVPHLTGVLIYQDAVISPAILEQAKDAAANKAGRKGSRRIDPLEGLDEADRVLFNTMRTWRNETAKEEGVPPSF